MFFSSQQNLLRSRDKNNDEPVKYPELFFDLVFVFVFTRVSHYLLEHDSLMGGLQTVLLIMAIWWVWVFTSWATNWLDPAKIPVRILLIAMTLAGLVLSVSLPEAFTGHGLVFAAAYAFMQVGRSFFMLYALERHNKKNHLNFKRITAWLVASGFFWIAGGFAEDVVTRLSLWAAALLIEYCGPAFYFRTPFLGRSTIHDWDVEGKHMSERCALFIIIALGETILVMGNTFTELDWNTESSFALLLAFFNCVVLWWIYFDAGVHQGTKAIDNSSNPGHYARLAYTYFHLPIAAGIIVASVGYEILLRHTGDTADIFALSTIIGGGTLFVTGNILFKRAVTGSFPMSHVTGIVLLAVLTVLAALYPLSVLVVSMITTAILMTVIACEKLSDKEGNIT